MKRGRALLKRIVRAGKILGLLRLLQRKANMIIDNLVVLNHIKGRGLKKIYKNLNTEAPNKLVKIKEPLTISFPLLRSKKVWNICINPRSWNSGEQPFLHLSLKSLLFFYYLFNQHSNGITLHITCLLIVVKVSSLIFANEMLRERKVVITNFCLSFMIRIVNSKSKCWEIVRIL